MNVSQIRKLAIAFSCISLTACASGQDTSAAPTPSGGPASVQSSRTPNDSQTPAESGSASAGSTEGTSDTTATTPGDPDTGVSSPLPTPSGGETPIVLDESRSGQELGENDFPFKDESWKGGVFSVDGAQVTGLATFLNGCSDSSAKELQLRLGKRFKKLTFVVGQGDLSKSVKDKVLVKVEANGRPITPKSVPFTTPTDFTVDATGVNGLTMTFQLDDNVQNCGMKGEVQTVVHKIIATK